MPPLVRAGLVVLGGSASHLRGTCFPIHKSPTVVGRAADCDLVLDGDTVSRRHCRFELRAGDWWMVDEASTSGCYVNDELIGRDRRLATGDRIRIGRLRLELVVGPDLDTIFARKAHDLWAEDDLTGVASEAYLGSLLGSLCASSQPVSIALADVDRLGAINQARGHLMGDAVLKDVASLARRVCGPLDRVARRGGGFALVMPRRDLAGAVAAAEELRSEAAARVFVFQADDLRLTLSVGVARAEGGTAGALLGLAEARLREAKAAGRDRVVG